MVMSVYHRSRSGVIIGIIFSLPGQSSGRAIVLSPALATAAAVLAKC